MSTYRFFSIHDALNRAGSDLGKLKETATLIRSYDRLLDSVLNQPLRSHVSVANVRDGQLVLLADSPVWASRVRPRLPEIRTAVNQRSPWPPLAGFRLITRPRSAAVPFRAARREPISDSTRRLLDAVANDIDNPRLRRTLRRIARRQP